MIRRPPESIRTATPCPSTTPFRSNGMTKQKQSRVRHQVDRRSLAEEIRDSLRERIVAGEFRDGDALIQELVAEEYGASRIPVREALRPLEACGLVSMETPDRKSGG